MVKNYFLSRSDACATQIKRGRIAPAITSDAKS